jgi:hypothetical protein
MVTFFALIYGFFYDVPCLAAGGTFKTPTCQAAVLLIESTKLSHTPAAPHTEQALMLCPEFPYF